MKKELLIIAIVILAGCAETKPREAKGLEEAIAVDQVAPLTEKMKVKIPSLDFSELNKYNTKISHQ